MKTTCGFWGQPDSGKDKSKEVSSLLHLINEGSMQIRKWRTNKRDKCSAKR